MQVLIEKQKEQLAAAQAASSRYARAIEDLRRQVSDQTDRKLQLQEANDMLVTEINQNGKSIQ